MTKQELTSKISEIELFIWGCGIDPIISEWDDYADKLLEQVEYWDNLSPDSLYEAYNQACISALKINKDYEKELNLIDE